MHLGPAEGKEDTVQNPFCSCDDTEETQEVLSPWKCCLYQKLNVVMSEDSQNLNNSLTSLVPGFKATKK